MLDELLVVAGSVLTLFLMMGVGFFFGKKGMLTGSTLAQLSKLLLYVVCPAIMIESFQVDQSPELIHQLIVAAVALAGTYILYMVLAQFCFRRKPEEERGVLRFASVYGNTGFMGLPLIQAVLGDEALMITVVSLAVFNLTTWTHGVLVIGGKKYFSLKKAVLNPGVIGFLISLLLFVTGLRLPGPVNHAVGYLGDLNTPLAMVVIGAQMASADLLATLRERRLYVASALKLVAMPVVTMLVLLPFHLDGLIFMTIVILSACPTAGSASLFCQTMGKDSSMAARQVTFSTLLCIITLPLTAVVARMLAG